MELFTSIQMKLDKNVKKGSQESLSSLFDFQERTKRMEVLLDMDEGQRVKAILEGLGETELVLGNDMEKGQRKTIMTLFWLPEKTKLIDMTGDAKEGENITITMWKAQ
jgi:hypothetical protein